ncbi:MAG: nuclear transport factor 2 family protein [bacterium]
MSYKKPLLTYIILLIIFASLLSSCSKKKKEEDITITLKTESTVPTQQVTSTTPSSPKPVTKEKQVQGIKKTETSIKQKVHEVTATQQLQTGKELQPPQQLSVNTPPPRPEPAPEDIARQEIMSIINRQKQAMKTKNLSLALEDLAGNAEQNKKALEDYFNRYEKIDVDFSNISINVAGNSAVVVMNQRTSVVTKSLIPQTITELTRVQWTFAKENDRWVISGTQILGRMKE